MDWIIRTEGFDAEALAEVPCSAAASDLPATYDGGSAYRLRARLNEPQRFGTGMLDKS